MTVDFNSVSDTDVVLLTTTQDGSLAEFHVHKKVLSEASPFFDAMFSLPQPRQDTTSRSKNKPFIPIPEPAHILERVLHYVYRIPTRPVSSLDELAALLAVATKYDLALVVESLRALLVSPEFMGADPLHVYAIACRFDLDQEAALASKWTLNIDLLDDEDDQSDASVPRHYLRHISAYDYHRLHVLHRRRARAAEALLKFPDNIKCMHCNGSVFNMHSPPKWWQEWVVGAKKELRKRPLETEKVFGVDYIFQAATKSGCVGCAESVLNSWTVLREMKEKIDQLPTTI